MRAARNGVGNAGQDSGMLQISQIWGPWGRLGQEQIPALGILEIKAWAASGACPHSRREFRDSSWIWGLYFGILGTSWVWGVLFSGWRISLDNPSDGFFWEYGKNRGGGGDESWESRECARKQGIKRKETGDKAQGNALKPGDSCGSGGWEGSEQSPFPAGIPWNSAAPRERPELG